MKRSAGTTPFQLKRYPANPILVPDLTSPWESLNVFNASVIRSRGLFHMHYRAQGVDYISRIGYAVSADGVRWNRLRQPVMVPETKYEIRGVEDPRITEIGGVYYMAYCGYAPYSGKGVEYCGSIYPMFARSENLITWERLGPMVEGEDNKDHMLFPRKFRGKFCAFHRRRPDVWIAYSKDLKSWPEKEMKTVCRSRPDVEWEGKYVGMNGVPIETDEGWLAFYHAADAKHVYRIGVMLLDRDDPSKVIARPRAPVLWPEEQWEMRGDVPNVVFSTANLLVGDEVWVYYGGGDHVIALATAKLKDLLAFVKS
jgi:predicted GH43/DUF377 family glycosyl hydrolase